MKSMSVMTGAILLALALTICSHLNAWGADWREFAEATTGVFYYDQANVVSSPEGFKRVWIHNVTRRETNLIELDCKEGKYRVLDRVEYDEANRIKARHDYYDNPTWLNISPRSVPESLRDRVCP